jgi:polyisoprenoid-binding protein YceI
MGAGRAGLFSTPARQLAVGAGLVALFLVADVGGAEAQARTFRIQRGGGSRIQWISDAPLERITGVTSAVFGEFQVDPANLAATRGQVHVEIASMRTGIDLRDEHLRGPDWLHAQRFPRATLEITGVEGAARLNPNETIRVTIRGRFTLHGVTRDVSATAQVRLVPLNDEMRAQGFTGDLIRAQAQFQIQLSDYGVSISAPVRLKVSNTITINVTIRAVAG